MKALSEKDARLQMNQLSQLRAMCFAITILLATHSTIQAEKPESFKIPKRENIDKVELLSITTEKGSIIKEVTGSKSLEGKDASKVVYIWRKQKIYPNTASACHNPPYAIKFYSGKSLVLFASICWLCNDMRFIVPESDHWLGFDGESLSGKELRRVFEEAFPSEKKEG
jgi:hypothetical protein